MSYKVELGQSTSISQPEPVTLSKPAEKPLDTSTISTLSSAQESSGLFSIVGEVFATIKTTLENMWLWLLSFIYSKDTSKEEEVPLNRPSLTERYISRCKTYFSQKIIHPGSLSRLCSKVIKGVLIVELGDQIATYFCDQIDKNNPQSFLDAAFPKMEEALKRQQLNASSQFSVRVVAFEKGDTMMINSWNIAKTSEGQKWVTGHSFGIPIPVNVGISSILDRYKKDTSGHQKFIKDFLEA